MSSLEIAQGVRIAAQEERDTHSLLVEADTHPRLGTNSVSSGSVIVARGFHLLPNLSR